MSGLVICAGQFDLLLWPLTSGQELVASNDAVLPHYRGNITGLTRGGWPAALTSGQELVASNEAVLPQYRGNITGLTITQLHC